MTHLVIIHRYYMLFISHSDFPILKIESLLSVISLTGATFATYQLNSSVFMFERNYVTECVECVNEGERGMR
jgi:hypothetical protein